MSFPSKLQHTPLHQWHTNAQAKMVPFAGFDMPLHYTTSIQEEHLWTRNHAGLFDVSHMGKFTLQGPHVLNILEQLTPTAWQDFPMFGCRYSVLTNHDGGIIDDLIVTRTGADIFNLVVNAANQKSVYHHLWDHLDDMTTMQDFSEDALIALQGPLAESILNPLCNHDLSTLKPMNAIRANVGEVPSLISRTGYTGEDGFEINCDAVAAATVWEKLIESGNTKPIGLAARDTLRLEAGMPLYGQDLDTSTSPVEASLGWILRQENQNFYGHSRICQEMVNTPKIKRVGIQLLEQGIARAGAEIFNETGTKVGYLTSGSFSPSLQVGIGQGYVETEHAQIGQKLTIDVRGKKIPARVHKLSFMSSIKEQQKG